MPHLLPSKPSPSNLDQIQHFILPEDVEEEAKIAKIEFYKSSQLKIILYYLFSVITLGLVALSAKWKLPLRVFFKYSKAYPQDAEFMIIHNEDTTKEHVFIQTKTLHVQKESQLYKTFSYRLYTYYLDTEENIFKPLQFLVKDKSYKQIHEEFGQGILSDAEYEQKLVTYGDNSTKIPMKTNIQILTDEILSPFYVFQVCATVLWMVGDYVIYSVVILFISTISIIMNFCSIKRNYRKLTERSHFEITVKAFRATDGNSQNLSPVNISSKFLVAGDLIEVPDEQFMPCDIILLKGTCVMNESMLTGESVPIIKHQLPISQKIFDASMESGYILYSGTKCLETKKNKNGSSAIGVVLRTGFSTMKGRLIRSLLYSKPENFRFYRDTIKYIGAMTLLAFICFCFTLKSCISQDIDTYNILVRAVSIFTTAVPPALATCLSIGCEIASRRLEKKGVATKSQTKINVAGRVNVMCFDKTGTLTEDSLDLYGVKPVESSLNTAKFLRTVKRNFGNEMNKPCQEGKKTLDHMMFELMATCHGLTHVKGILSGDPLDLKMFGATGWQVDDDHHEGSSHDDARLSTVKPSVESMSSGGYFNENSNVALIKRFDFSAKLQRMSVIVRDPKENKQRVYVKGSPEMMKLLCKEHTIPEAFNYTLSQYAQNGLRVIACGTREVEGEVTPFDNLEREDFEKDLDYLGFIIFENRLKPATNGVIKKLNDAAIKTVMLTGDNPLTAVFIARSCGILENEKRVMLAILKVSEEDSSVKHLEWQSIEPCKTDSSVKIQPENNEDTICLEMAPMISKEVDQREKEQKTIPLQLNNFEKFYQDHDITIAMTGEALSYLKATNSDPALYRTALRKAKVFARMRPEEKALVVEEFQKQDYTVGMCGDGANDCPALKAANVGVSLSEAEASIAAPFLSKIPDITCIDIVLREGRAALATSFQCFKYMSMYAFMQTLSLALLYDRKTNFTDESFLFEDLFLVLPLATMMCYTEARKKLSKAEPHNSLLSLPILASIIGQIIIQSVFQILVIKLLPSQEWYISSDGLHPGDTELNDYNVSFESIALFLLTNFQYIATVLAFSAGKPFRKAFYTNIKFILVLMFAIASSLFLLFTDADFILTNMKLLLLPRDFQLTILILAAVNSAITLSYEVFFVQCVVRKISEWRKEKKYVEKSRPN